MRHVLFNWPAGDHEPLHDRCPDGSNYYHTSDTASGLSEPLVLGFLSHSLIVSRIWRSFYFGKPASPIGVRCGLEKSMFLLVLYPLSEDFVSSTFQECRTGGMDRGVTVTTAKIFDVLLLSVNSL